MVSASYLLDSNVLSEPLRPDPNMRVLERLQVHQSEIVTAAAVWHELLYGARRWPLSRRRRTIERYLHDVVRATISILPYDTAAAEWHAAERARLLGEGRTPPFVDGQIAAVANTNGLTLVTANVAEYVGFSDLVVEDWRS